MSDSLERLYLAVIAAKDLDPAISRTARLFQRGPAKMAKKLAEEAIEVVIDAVNRNPDAVIRESADLLYNLTVLWASAAVQPEDVWREMERREDLLGIAEKMPKSEVKMPTMSQPRPRQAWVFATLCTVASVAGGLLGYAIGALLYDSLGQWLINLYGLGGKVEAFRASYAEWGAWIIIGKGLTPIPYKLVTITSGFAGYNIWLFILCSMIARGGRFFVVAILLNRYGDAIRAEIEKRLGMWVALGAAVLVLGFYIAFKLV